MRSTWCFRGVWRGWEHTVPLSLVVGVRVDLAMEQKQTWPGRKLDTDHFAWACGGGDGCCSGGSRGSGGLEGVYWNSRGGDYSDAGKTHWMMMLQW